MARYILANRVQLESIELKAGREVDEIDADRIRRAGGFLVLLPNPIVEARAAIVCRQGANGRREAELDILVAAIAEYVASGNATSTMQAACDAADAIGNAVYLTGPAAVTTVDITNQAKMPVVGIISSKTSPTSCVVTLFGLMTPGVPLTPQRVYFASLTGGLIDTVPLPRPIFLQAVGHAIDTTQLLVKPSLNYTRLV